MLWVMIFAARFSRKMALILSMVYCRSITSKVDLSTKLAISDLSVLRRRTIAYAKQEFPNYKHY